MFAFTIGECITHPTPAGQPVPCAGAGDMEQLALGLINVVQFDFVGGAPDPGPAAKGVNGAYLRRCGSFPGGIG